MTFIRNENSKMDNEAHQVDQLTKSNTEARIAKARIAIQGEPGEPYTRDEYNVTQALDRLIDETNSLRNNVMHLTNVLDGLSLYERTKEVPSVEPTSGKNLVSGNQDGLSPLAKFLCSLAAANRETNDRLCRVIDRLDIPDLANLFDKLAHS